MVDVHAGVAPPALDDPVDEALEGVALAVAVAPPDAVVVHGAVVVAVAAAEEVLEPARGLVERMALEVEPDVAGVRLGQEAEAALLLVRQELAQVLAGRGGSGAGARPGGGPARTARRRCPSTASRRRCAGRSRAAASVVNPVPMSVSACARRMPGDEDEVVVVSTRRSLAQVAEVAEPAVVARPGVRLGLVLERAEEALADAAVVRRRTRRRGTSRARPSRARRGSARGSCPGSARAARSRSRSWSTCAAWRERASFVSTGSYAAVRLPLEEVREPAPGAVREVRLVDDVGFAGADRLLGEPPRLVARRSPRRRRSGARRSASLAHEPREVRRLVLVSLAADEVAVRVVELRLLDLAALGTRASASSGAGRRGGRRGRTARAAASRRREFAWEEYQRFGGCALRHARGVRSCNHACCCIARPDPICQVTGASPARETA